MFGRFILGLAVKKIALMQEVLKQIRGTKTASAEDSLVLRVASRYLIANMKLEYDRFLRLQVLEGAAKVPVDRWWKKGKLGFRVAREAFEGTAIQPEWLDPSANSDMYKTLERVANAAIRSYGLTWEPFDLINNALMGIPMDASKQGQTLRPPYEVGKFLSVGIKSGKETPVTVAKGLLGKFIKRKVQNEAQNLPDALPEDEEGRTKDIPDTTPPAYDSIGEFLAALMFGKGAPNPLSKKLVGLMYKVWGSSNRKHAQMMLTWLEWTLAGKSFTLQELGDTIGSSPQVITKYFFPAAWNEFFKALGSNRQLLKEISDAAYQVGVEWDPNDPIPLYWDDPMSAAKGKSRPKIQASSNSQKSLFN